MARTATVPPSVGSEFPMKAAIDQVLTHRAGLAVIAASAVLLFWRLGQNELASWDEAIYAQVSKEILSSGDWVTLHWGHRPWFEKPPLFMWATAILYKWFGVNELWSRVGSAVSGVGVAALTYLIGKRIYDRPVGLGAVLILLTTPHFVSSARIATTDIALTCFVYLAVYGYVRTWDGDTRWWYLAWTGIALAVMSKGAGGLIAPMAIGACVLIHRRSWASVRSRDCVLGFLLALLIVAPWHVAVYLQHGTAFIDSYVRYHVLARSTRPLEGHTGGPFFYIDLLATTFFPWLYLAPFALALAVKRNVARLSQALVLLAVVAMVLAVYTVVRTKLAWYVIPVYPGLALLISAMIRESVSRHATIALSMAAFFVFVAVKNVAPVLEASGLKSVSQISKAAGGDGDVAASLIVYSDMGWPTVLFYSDRPVIVATSEADVARIVTRHESQAIVLDRKDLRELAAHHQLEVVAERRPYVYARIARKPSAPQ